MEGFKESSKPDITTKFEENLVSSFKRWVNPFRLRTHPEEGVVEGRGRGRGGGGQSGHTLLPCVMPIADNTPLSLPRCSCRKDCQNGTRQGCFHHQDNLANTIHQRYLVLEELTGVELSCEAVCLSNTRGDDTVTRKRDARRRRGGEEFIWVLPPVLLLLPLGSAKFLWLPFLLLRLQPTALLCLLFDGETVLLLLLLPMLLPGAASR